LAGEDAGETAGHHLVKPTPRHPDLDKKFSMSASCVQEELLHGMAAIINQPAYLMLAEIEVLD
jgi:hypothetical protein